MEDKKLNELNDETLDQVAGGSGDGSGDVTYRRSIVIGG